MDLFTFSFKTGIRKEAWESSGTKEAGLMPSTTGKTIMKYVLFERQYYTGNNKKPAEDAITAFAKANNAEAVGIMPIPNTNSIYVLFKVPEN